MYPYSTQKRHWTVESEQKLIEMRMKSNQEFIRIHGPELDVSSRFSVCLQFKILLNSS